MSDGHPVRFTDEGFDIDYKTQNAYEWYLKVSHHEDYSMWFPAGINSDQRPLIEALYAGNTDPGGFRLIERSGKWYLHITVHFEVAESETIYSESNITSVGVDIGETALATVCHRDKRGSLIAPTLWNAFREVREGYFTAMRRLQRRDADVLTGTYGDEIWRQVDGMLHTVSREVVVHVADIVGGVVVLEDLTHIRENMDCGDYMNHRLHGLAFANPTVKSRTRPQKKGLQWV